MTRKPEMSPVVDPYNPNAHTAHRRRGRGGLIAGAAGLALLTGLVVNKADQNNQVSSDPACEVTADRGSRNQVGAIQGELHASGQVKVWDVDPADKGTPFVRDPRNTKNFLVGGSYGLQPEDEVVLEHVDPQVCVKVGGHVLDSIDQAPVVRPTR